MKMSPLSLVCMFALALGLAGCSTPSSRIESNPAAFKAATPEQQEQIMKGVVSLGFTPDLVRLAIGNPDSIRTRLDKDGTSEVWLYRTYEVDGYYRHHSYPYRSVYDDAFFCSPAHSSRRTKDIGRIVFVGGKVVSIEREDPVR